MARTMTTVPPNKTQPMNQGAVLDPAGIALVQKLKALAQEADSLGVAHVAHVRVQTTNALNPPNCSCMCDCS